MSNIEEYYQWICNNPNKVCKKIKTIYKKLVDEIHTEKELSFVKDGKQETHKYHFDIKKAQRPIEFIETFCKQSKGKWNGKQIKLQLFQKAMIEAAFGFVDEKGLRKYKKVIFFVARKNGKSVLDSALALFCMIADKEGGAEIYSVARMVATINRVKSVEVKI